MSTRRVLNRFQLDEAVAATARSEVWRGVDLRTGAPVAIKLSRPGTTEDRLRARREAATLRLLNLPGVVRLDWLSGAGPDLSSFTATNFSVRWRKTFWLAPGRHRCLLRCDEGVRLYVDGTLLVDRWDKRATTPAVVEFDTLGGDSTIVVEYVDRSGAGRVRFDMLPVGWLGEYYPNRDLSGLPALYRVDPEIRFDWSASPPDPRLSKDNFSVRWSRWLTLPVGRYTVSTTVDDGIRVSIDGVRMIDRWSSASPATNTVTLDLVGRPALVVVEYFEQTGSSLCNVSFQRIS